MAGLNKLHMQVWGGGKFVPNTFVGQIGTDISSKEDMASYLSVSASDLKVFSIAPDNTVSFYVGKEHSLAHDAFYLDNFITSYWDLDGKIIGSGGRVFYPDPQPSLQLYAYLPKLNYIGQQMFIFHQNSLNYNLEGAVSYDTNQIFRGSGTRNLRLPLLEYTVGSNPFQNAFDNPRNKRGYLPKFNPTMIQTNSADLYGAVINSGVIIYTHPDMATADSGNPHPSIVNIISQGAIVRYVTSFTPPENITDLSASDITATSVKLNFTPPTAVNGLDFYEIWLDDGTGKLEQKYFPIQQELTASGQTLTGLTPGTTYKIKLSAIDMFYNGAGQSTTPAFSNEVIFTTL